MKTVFLVAGGRGGSDFFQGLLDSHKEILSFPGYLRVDEDFKKLFDQKNNKDIAKKFINLYPHFFNSKNNFFERHNRLGKEKNKYFRVDKKKFIFNFLKLNEYNSKNSKSYKFNIIKDLHIAYAQTVEGKKYKKKIIFIHTHLVEWTENFFKLMPIKNAVIIHIIRHPLASLSSPIKNWLNFNDGNSFFPKDLYFQIDLVFNGIYNLLKLSKVYVIQYEYLHWYHKKVMKDFCKVFNVKYNKSLEESTKLGLTWWGDKVSKKWLSGISKNFKINIDKNYFYDKDLIFFQYLTRKIIKKYNYKFLVPYEEKNFILFPLKCEILVWKNTLKHFIQSFRWKHLISIPLFYILRIVLIRDYFLRESKILPYSIGTKYIKGNN
tara:strand:+ start:1093 stop:2226 length:1134 start_codon:yes stop_codon:yes gene_type:complete